jgi:HK97 family phage prohead protease
MGAAIKYMDVALSLKDLNEEGTFEGYGSVFGVVDSYNEVVMPGAFKASLKEHKKNKTWPKMLWQHRSAEPIGVYETLEEDDVGLFVKGKLLLEVQRARETHVLLKHGALDGLSIGYVPVKEKWEPLQEDGPNVLKLFELDLWEVSPVTFPANGKARVSDVKSIADRIQTIREFEDFLRDVGGFSCERAKVLASRGFKALAREEPESTEELASAITRNISILKG